MNTPRTHFVWTLVPWVLLALCLGVSLSIEPTLPARIATHWGLNGVPNGFMPRLPGVLFVPALGVLLLGIIGLVARLDPRASRGGTPELLREVRVFLALFLCAIQAMILAVATGVALPVSVIVEVLIGALFVALGWSIGRVRASGPVVLNVPWKVQTDAFKVRLQKMAGRHLLFTGLVIALGTLLFNPLASLIVMFVAIAGMAVALLHASYRLAREERHTMPRA
jgi:uncharacterized membrane protein